MKQTVQFPDVQRRFFDKCLTINARDAPPAFSHMNRLLSGLCSPTGIRQSRSGLGIYMISGDGSSVTIGRRYAYLISASEELLKFFDLPRCEFVFFLTNSKTVSQSFDASFIFVGYPIVMPKTGGLDVTRVCVRSFIDIENDQVIKDPDEVFHLFLQFEKQGKVKDDECRVPKTSCRRKRVTKSETTESPEESAQDTTCGQTSSKQESEGSPDNCEVKVDNLHSDQEFSDVCADVKKGNSVQGLPPFSDETVDGGFQQQQPEVPLEWEDNSFEVQSHETPLYLDGDEFGSFYPSNTSYEFSPSESLSGESPFSPDLQNEILF